MAKNAIAKKKLKVGTKWIQPGEEVKQWNFFKARNKQSLINTGKVKVVEVEDDMDIQQQPEE